MPHQTILEYSHRKMLSLNGIPCVRAYVRSLQTLALFLMNEIKYLTSNNGGQITTEKLKNVEKD